MRKIARSEQTPLFVPHFVADSLFDIDFAELHKLGVRYVAFDADHTLVGYRHKQLDPKAKKFLKSKLAQFKGVCIASNRVTNDLHEIGAAIDAEIIRASLTARKPSHRFFDRVIDHFKTKPKNIAMIGDKLIADVFGGNRSGMVTVWVKKNGRDSIIDNIIQTRRFEKIMTRGHIK